MMLAIRRLLVLCLAIAFAPCSLHAAQKTCPVPGLTHEQCAPAATHDYHNLVIYGETKILVTYVNSFRFDVNPLINSTAIAGASLPTGLGISPSAAAATLPTAPKSAGEAGKASFVGDLAADLAADACAPAAVTDRGGVDACWSALKTQESSLVQDVASIRKTINVSIRSVADEQHCYLIKFKDYSQPILTLNEAKGLVDFAVATRSNLALDARSNSLTINPLACYKGDAQSWPSGLADSDASQLTELQNSLTNLGTASGFAAWASLPGHQGAYNAMVALVGNLLSEATSYATRVSPANSTANIGQTFTDFQTALDANQNYRDRLINIATSAASRKENLEDVLVLTIPLNPCAEWYGKGRTDAISLQYSDITSGPNATPPSMSLGTNTCTPRSIASTGIGVTFNSNPVYDFVPSDNTGSLVIGETAVNKASPLYAVLYNVALFPSHRSVEFFASPGIGLTSSSSTTTADFLGGLSLSLARRLIFITPSLDFGRRDQLAPGFSLGTAKGSLTAVPTQSHWSSQFMISISFGIGPS